MAGARKEDSESGPPGAGADYSNVCHRGSLGGSVGSARVWFVFQPRFIAFCQAIDVGLVTPQDQHGYGDCKQQVPAIMLCTEYRNFEQTENGQQAQTNAAAYDRSDRNVPRERGDRHAKERDRPGKR